MAPAEPVGGLEERPMRSPTVRTLSGRPPCTRPHSAAVKLMVLTLGAAILPSAAAVVETTPAPPAVLDMQTVLEADVQSDFSRIRVYRFGSVRTLTFVRPDGSEALESRVDMAAPHRQIFPYTKLMFMHYLHAPPPERVSIVGLGGGSMVHFLQKYAPDVNVTVVEIDPAVIDTARRFFGVKPDDRLSIVQQDGAKYFAETDETFDVIYLDAFMSVSERTDATGMPLDLKANEFLQTVRKRLSAQGVAVFNVNHHARSDEDIRGIAAAFRNTYVYRLPGQSVVVATLQEKRDATPEIVRRAKELDARLRADFAFVSLVRHLQR